MWSYLFIGILCLAGGAIILGVVKNLIETIVFLRAAVKTEGKVIYLAKARNSDQQAMYLPVFEYRTNDGTAFQYTSTTASNPPAYKIGDTATILYLRKNPQNAKINSFWELWILKFIFALLGVACFGGALLIFLALKRH